MTKDERLGNLLLPGCEAATAPAATRAISIRCGDQTSISSSASG
jgi:hypothetical protein